MTNASLNIRPMMEAEVPLGLALAEQAGWNQTLDDWRRQFRLDPSGCFVATLEGRLVGTVATCMFSKVGWVAMMLVDESYRRRGIGRTLMNRALDYLDHCGAESIRLDATPLGAPLYAELGFRGQFSLDRFAGTAIAREPTDRQSVELLPSPGNLAALRSIDQDVYGYDRSDLIQRLNQDPEVLVWLTKDADAFAMKRPGRIASYLGPCLARKSAVGAQLLTGVLQFCNGASVFLDIPRDNIVAVQVAKRFGLSPVRSLLRMTRGIDVQENVGMLFSSNGPEKG